MGDWESDLTAEWRRHSSQRWDRRRSGRPPGGIAFFLAIAVIVVVVRYWRSDDAPPAADTRPTTVVAVAPPAARPPAEPELPSHAALQTWRRQTLRAPAAPAPMTVATVTAVPIERKVVAAAPEPLESLLDKLWFKTEQARLRGDTEMALVALRTIAQEYPEDARTPKAAFMLAALTPAAEERCLALAMVVGLAPSSSLATDARQRLPSACARPN